MSTNRNVYGARETNSLGVNGAEYHACWNGAPTVYWTEPGLKIVRLRLLSDPGFPFWDISYCHGEMNGKPVEVQLPFDQLPKKNMYRILLAYAKKDKVYAKGLGIFNAISTLN